MTRRVFLALLLGLAPFFAGCFAGHIDSTDVARKGVAYVGERISVRVVVAAATSDPEREIPPIVRDLVSRSLVNVLRETKLFADVRLAGEAAAAATGTAAVLPPGGDLPEVRFEPEVLDFALYQSYGWWGLYAVFFAIPVIGTSAIIIVIFLAGGPIVSDHGALAIRVRAVEGGTGKRLGEYEGATKAFEPHNIWNAGEHLESFYYHPEELLQGACGEVVEKLVQDRWTYGRLAAGEK